MDVLVRKKYTLKDIAKSMEADPKPRRLTAGSWVSDLASLKKLVLLCSGCTHKFNPAKLGYRRDPEFPHSLGKCDGCSTFDMKCVAFFHEEVFTQVRSTAAERRATRNASRKRLKSEGTL